MHQWSVLSQWLFAVVMDVIPSEVRNGISSELLYVVDLVLTAHIMLPLGGQVTKWLAFLTKESLKQWWKGYCKLLKVTCGVCGKAV